MTIALIGIDLAKYYFQVHGVDNKGNLALKRRVHRSDLLGFLKGISPCVIAMEACGSAHYWGRECQRFGHVVKLIPPQYVKPYVKTNKNDAADAEAIVEATTRPSMRFVPLKSTEQQELLAFHRTRERLMKARTALVNSLRGLLSEHGVVIPRGLSWLNRQLPRTREECERRLNAAMPGIFERTLSEYRRLDDEISHYDSLLNQYARNHPIAQRLMQVPGVGVLTATAAIAVIGAPQQFKNGRHFAAYLGLVPRQHSSGGKERLLSISKRGNVYLRRLLIGGAQSLLRWGRNKDGYLNSWIRHLLERKTWNLTATAVANKNARIIWHLLAHDVDYTPRRLEA